MDKKTAYLEPSSLPFWISLGILLVIYFAAFIFIAIYFYRLLTKGSSSGIRQTLMFYILSIVLVLGRLTGLLLFATNFKNKD